MSKCIYSKSYFMILLTFICIVPVVISNFVLVPDKEGVDVGITFVTGAFLVWEQYLNLGYALQNLFPGRLWIHLQDNIFYHESGSTVNNFNNTFLGRGKLELWEAGMPENAKVFGVGHSLGGTIIYGEMRNTEIENLTNGIILLAATMFDQDYDTFPVPSMLMSGDLDGQMRSFLIAKDYRSAYAEILNGNENYKYRYAHRLMIGVNHAGFCTEPYPDAVESYWIEPELTQPQMWQLISESILTFITYHTMGDDASKSELDTYFEGIRTFVEPIYKVLDQEYDAAQDRSAWSVYGQEIIGDLPDEEKSLLQVTNIVVNSRNGLERENPVIEMLSNGTVVVDTYTYLNYLDSNREDINVSAFALESKYKSSQAIKDAIRDTDEPNEPILFCVDVNQLTWETVYDMIGNLEKQRYENVSITVIFEDDVVYDTEEEWVSSESLFSFNSTHLRIQASSYISDNDNGGMHHCKLMSPARVLEFVYTDSLYTIFYMP